MPQAGPASRGRRPGLVVDLFLRHAEHLGDELLQRAHEATPSLVSAVNAGQLDGGRAETSATSSAIRARCRASMAAYWSPNRREYSALHSRARTSASSASDPVSSPLLCRPSRTVWNCT